MPIGDPVVLDTHVFVWLILGDPKLARSTSRKLIEKAGENNALFVPAISIWEIGMLESKGRIRFNRPCLAWVEEALTAPGIRLAPLTPTLAIDSTRLPGDFHGDPADRLITATARELKATLITGDHALQKYGREGHVLVHGV